jgi:hypothetical protein
VPAANGNPVNGAVALGQQGLFGGTPVTTPAQTGAPQPAFDGPPDQVDPTAFSNALISQGSATATIAEQVSQIERTGNGIRSNEVFADPGAGLANHRVFGSLSVNGKLGVPQPPRSPGAAQTLPLATPGVNTAMNPYNQAAPTSAPGAFALGAVSSQAAAAALNAASSRSSNQQYAAELSHMATDNRFASTESAVGISLLAAAAGSGVFGPASAVSRSARELMLGTVAPWAFGRISDANAARGFGVSYNYLAGAGV